MALQQEGHAHDVARKAACNHPRTQIIARDSGTADKGLLLGNPSPLARDLVEPDIAGKIGQRGTRPAQAVIVVMKDGACREGQQPLFG